MASKATTNRPPEVQAARNDLRRKGYSHLTASKLLGVTRVHLTFVLNNRRKSARLLKAIQNLPENKTPA